MIIKKEAAKIVLTINKNKNINLKELNNEFIEELNLSGIIKFPSPASVELTYGGNIIGDILIK